MKPYTSGFWLIAVIFGFAVLMGGCSDSPGASLPQEVEGYKAKAKQGDGVAQGRLGLCYLLGFGVKADRDECKKCFRQAVILLRKAADHGDHVAQTQLGHYYSNPFNSDGSGGVFGVERDMPEAAKWYLMAAEQGDTEAQIELAKYYESDGSRDSKKAMKWQLKAADQGDANAQLRLGEYWNGAPSCVEWYRKAALQGNSEAQASLGKLYLTYWHIVGGKNNSEAYAWLNLAGHRNPTRENISPFVLVSQFEAIQSSKYEIRREFSDKFALGLSPEELSRGQQRTKELQKEIDANIAAKKDFGDDPATQFLIGSTVYDSVFRTPSTDDLVEAVTWYRKAAEQGHAEAQFNLGVCYFNGKGVVKDLNVAYAYWSVAGITNEDARNNLARIERQMSADQIADGKKRATELQKQIDTRIAAKKPRK